MTAAPVTPIVLTRSYRATVEQLAELFTTKDGFESWWGPDGFRVEVHALEARTGGRLHYDMIADAADKVAAMKSMGQPISHGTTATFSVFDPPRRLELTHVVDVVAGVTPYESRVLVEFLQEGAIARMTITLWPMHDPMWTEMALAGWTSQLTKLDGRWA